MIGSILGAFAIAAAVIRLLLPLLADHLREWAVIAGAMASTALLFGTAGAVIGIAGVFWATGAVVGAGTRAAWLLRTGLAEATVGKKS